MPDISMCMNYKCKLKDNCYRFQAKPSKRQSYCDFECDDGICEDYWERPSGLEEEKNE